MQATHETLAVTSRVLGLDIMELWIKMGSESASMHCSYIFAADQLLLDYPDLVDGPHPKIKVDDCQLSLSVSIQGNNY